jgi:CheY-like chemotaxis protein/HPt (histidine-containing phosphotransfer) domain-containing protein
MAFNVVDPVEQPSKRYLKILVVDDDDLNRRMMRLILVRAGHDVQVVANGVEALDAVKEQKFDVVFMDLQMPIMDGFEASRRIREWENGGLRTYIVALTASYLPEEGQRLFEAGIDNYISKPFEVEHIYRLLSVIAKADHFTPVVEHFDVEGFPENNGMLDIQKGLHQLGGDIKTYCELLNDFIQELPGRISTLERSLEEKDMASLAREAHNLKGVSSNLGALQLFDYASKLDKQSNEGYTDQTQTLIMDIKRAGSALQKIATDFLEKKSLAASA